MDVGGPLGFNLYGPYLTFTFAWAGDAERTQGKTVAKHELN